MLNVYKNCPAYNNKTFTLTYVSKEDCADLLKVYSDIKAVPLVNRNN